MSDSEESNPGSDSKMVLNPFVETKLSCNTVACSHYARSCKLVAPCCNKVYPCRLCHDEAQSSVPVKESHTLDRKAVEEVVCRKCELRQPVAATCSSCNTIFGAAYFCPICRLYDDKDKQQFHCEGCGICRVGGKDNFDHCYTCCLCFKKDTPHKCVENSAKANCPVCMEDIHGSTISAAVPPCGHLLHSLCQKGMFQHGQYACPVCSKSMVDMSEAWTRINRELEETPMPLPYRHLYRSILCNDCNKTGKTKFHVVGMKCNFCGSFNTVMGEGPMVRRIPPKDENDEETFAELTEDEYRVLTDVPLPIPDGIELSDDDDYEEEDDDDLETSDNENNVENTNENPDTNSDNLRENTVTMTYQEGSDTEQIRDLELD